MRGDRRIVRTGDVDLCVETFGDPAQPAVLLIMGAAASMDWWPDDFCRGLADTGRFVIRYDLRDTGESTTWPPGEPGYAGSDLADDAIAILDALAVDAAHLVGMSMGAAIAQGVALGAPDRVSSLTLISTTPATGGAADLPPMSDDLAASFSRPPPDIDWSDRSAVVDHVTEEVRLMQGSTRVDDESLRALVGRVFDRSQDMAATMENHFALADEGDTAEDPGAIGVSTVVLHGTEDPLFPYPHGEAVAAAIPGAELVPLEGVGHGELPPAVWTTVIDAIQRVSAVGSADDSA